MKIIHRLACPHTRHQNGIVERNHKHVVETYLTLIAQANIPLKYWEHTFVIASYLVNHFPTPFLGHKSPHFVLLHREPNFKILRTFGCACFPLFVHIMSMNYVINLRNVFFLVISCLTKATSALVLVIVFTFPNMSFLISCVFLSKKSCPHLLIQSIIQLI